MVQNGDRHHFAFFLWEICAFSLNAVGDPMHAAYSPVVYNYHEHLASIKEEFDPDNLCDATFYVNRETTDELIKVMEAGEDISMHLDKAFGG